jgi:hypothetical protein
LNIIPGIVLENIFTITLQMFIIIIFIEISFNQVQRERIEKKKKQVDGKIA